MLSLQKSFWDLQDEILDLPTYWLDYMYRDYMRFKTKKFGVHYKYPNELSALSGQKWYRKLNQAHADFLNNGGWYLVGFAYGPAFSFISGGLPATAIRLMRIGAVTRMVVDASSQYITKGKIDWVSVGVSGLPKVGVMWRLILESMDAVIDFSIDDGVETIWYGKDMDEVLTDFGFGSILGTLDEIDATSFFKYASSIDETLSAETLENILTGMNGLFRYFMEANVGEAIKGENEVKTEDYNGDSDTREHSVRNL